MNQNFEQQQQQQAYVVFVNFSFDDPNQLFENEQQFEFLSNDFANNNNNNNNNTKKRKRDIELTPFEINNNNNNNNDNFYDSSDIFWPFEQQNRWQPDFVQLELLEHIQAKNESVCETVTLQLTQQKQELLSIDTQLGQFEQRRQQQQQSKIRRRTTTRASASSSSSSATSPRPSSPMSVASLSASSSRATTPTRRSINSDDDDNDNNSDASFTATTSTAAPAAPEPPLDMNELKKQANTVFSDCFDEAQIQLLLEIAKNTTRMATNDQFGKFFHGVMNSNRFSDIIQFATDEELGIHRTPKDIENHALVIVSEPGIWLDMCALCLNTKRIANESESFVEDNGKLLNKFGQARLQTKWRAEKCLKGPEKGTKKTFLKNNKSWKIKRVMRVSAN